MYCEGLQYFVPLITAEEDASKREHLQKQATNYMERAEEIKRAAKQAYFFQRQNSASVSTESKACAADTNCPAEPKSKATENPVLVAINPTSSFKQLREFIIEQLRCVRLTRSHF